MAVIVSGSREPAARHNSILDSHESISSSDTELANASFATRAYLSSNVITALRFESELELDIWQDPKEFESLILQAGRVKENVEEVIVRSKSTPTNFATANCRRVQNIRAENPLFDIPKFLRELAAVPFALFAYSERVIPRMNEVEKQLVRVQAEIAKSSLPQVIKEGDNLELLRREVIFARALRIAGISDIESFNQVLERAKLPIRSLTREVGDQRIRDSELTRWAEDSIQRECGCSSAWEQVREVQAIAKIVRLTYAAGIQDLNSFRNACEEFSNGVEKSLLTAADKSIAQLRRELKMIPHQSFFIEGIHSRSEVRSRVEFLFDQEGLVEFERIAETHAKFVWLSNLLNNAGIFMHFGFDPQERFSKVKATKAAQEILAFQEQMNANVTLERISFSSKVPNCEYLEGDRAERIDFKNPATLAVLGWEQGYSDLVFSAVDNTAAYRKFLGVIRCYEIDKRYKDLEALIEKSQEVIAYLSAGPEAHYVVSKKTLERALKVNHDLQIVIEAAEECKFNPLNGLASRKLNTLASNFQILKNKIEEYRANLVLESLK